MSLNIKTLFKYLDALVFQAFHREDNYSPLSIKEVLRLITAMLDMIFENGDSPGFLKRNDVHHKGIPGHLLPRPNIRIHFYVAESIVTT